MRVVQFFKQVVDDDHFSLRRFADRGGGKGSIDGWGLAFRDGRDIRLYKEPDLPPTVPGWCSFSSGSWRAHWSS